MANAALDNLQQQIKATADVLTAADQYVKGVPALITDAVNKALSNGATAAELAPLTDLANDMKAKADQITQDIAANTPQAPQAQAMRSKKP